MNAENKPKRLGEILMDEGVITEDQLNIALTEQKKVHEPLGKLLVNLGFATEAIMRAALGEALEQESVDLSRVVPDPDAIKMINSDTARKHKIIPLNYDPVRSTLSVWNGGLPDILLCSGSGYQRIHSRHLPLGVSDDSRVLRNVELLPLPPGSRLLLYSDGLTDAVNPAGQRYDEQRLEAAVRSGCEAGSLFDGIVDSVHAFRQKSERSDDLTLVEIDCEAIAGLVSGQADRPALRRRPAVWQLRFDLGLDVWREIDPLPAVVQMVTDIQGLHEHKERLYIIIGELLSNALDHGLLRLDSGLKTDPRGFVQYYVNRAATLATLREGMISIEIGHRPLESGGRLTIHVVDSGPGFDHRQQIRNLLENTAHSGRGVSLASSLCESLTYHGHGNHVEAVYRWQ